MESSKKRQNCKNYYPWNVRQYFTVWNYLCSLFDTWLFQMAQYIFHGSALNPYIRNELKNPNKNMRAVVQSWQTKRQPSSKLQQTTIKHTAEYWS